MFRDALPRHLWRCARPLNVSNLLRSHLGGLRACELQRTQDPSPGANRNRALTPSAGASSGAHEWGKHGTCTTLAESAYFSAALKASRHRHHHMSSGSKDLAGRQEEEGKRTRTCRTEQAQVVVFPESMQGERVLSTATAVGGSGRVE